MNPRAKIAALLALALGFVLSVVGTASAGYRAGPYQVTINDAGRWANGGFAEARGSADGNQSIGCYQNTGSGTCIATNAAGTSRTCTTTNAALIEVIRSLTPESYLYFQWNVDGTCSYVLVETSSRFKPAATSGT
jgi:hypothetical protein